MAAQVVTSITTTVSGLTSNEDSLTTQFSPAAPTKSQHGNVILAANTNTQLDLNGISTPTGIWINNTSPYSFDIDTTYSSPTLVPKITVPAGQAAYFVPPSGAVIWVESASAATFEYLLFG
jgi:hypothetical protein